MPAIPTKKMTHTHALEAIGGLTGLVIGMITMQIQHDLLVSVMAAFFTGMAGAIGGAVIKMILTKVDRWFNGEKNGNA
jgi:hypothetical protein